MCDAGTESIPADETITGNARRPRINGGPAPAGAPMRMAAPGKPRRRSINSRLLLTLALGLFAALLCGVLTALNGVSATRQVREQIRTRLRDVVVLSAQRMDAGVHDTLTERGQEGGVEYRKIQKKLQELQAGATDIHFAYTMRAGDGHSIVFVVDADTNQVDVAHLGDVYRDASEQLQSRFASLDAPFVEQTTYTDHWGTWLSGYAPFYGADGLRAGVLGMDIRADAIAAVRRNAFLTAGGVLVCVLPLCGLLGWVLAGYLTRPIRDLSVAASALIQWPPRSRHHTSAVSELAALHVTLATMRDVLDGIRDTVVATDLGGSIVYINDACCIALGRQRQELLGQSVRVFGDAPDRGATQTDILRVTREQGSWRGEVVNLMKDGKEIVFDCRTYLMRDEHGMPVGMVGISTDITKQKKEVDVRHGLEMALRQAQRLESMGTLAGGVAHEINNPIMGIMNYAQLILDKLGPDSPVSEYASEIGHETKRVATIVRNLLSFARQEKDADRSPARMCDIVESTLSLCRTVLRHDQIALEVDVPENLPNIECRSEQIRQVIMNLLTNARDALNEKYPGYDDDKVIVVKAECGMRNAEGRWERGAGGIETGSRGEDADPSSIPQSEIRDPQSVSRILRLTVEDHGPGIDKELRTRIMEPFFTTKRNEKGTGLGLAVSYGIVTDHGGELSVESEVGKWTRVHVDLPIADCGMRNAE